MSPAAPTIPAKPAVRAWLLVAADRPDRFATALSCGADAVVIDLSDVAATDRTTVRSALGDWLAAMPARPDVPLWLRIEAAGRGSLGDDEALLSHPAVAGALLSKTESPADVDAAREAGARAVVPRIETAAGFDRLREITAAPAVERLAFGSIELQLDLGLRDANEEELLVYRTQVVLASRLAGIGAPVDGISTAIDHEGQIRDDSLRARRLGFAGKLCLHPKQVTSVRQYFAPTAQEIDWARRVLAAAAAAPGSAALPDGRRLDKPTLARAQAIIDEAALG